MDNKEAADKIEAVRKHGGRSSFTAEFYEALDLAIAALRAQGEPRGWLIESSDGTGYRFHEKRLSEDWQKVHEMQGRKIIPLYTAPPPVRVPDMQTPETTYGTYHDGKVDGWNECRKEVLRLNAAPSGWQDVSKKYDELLYAVQTKHPNESRHETALRYIRNAESQCRGSVQTAPPSEGGES